MHAKMALLGVIAVATVSLACWSPPHTNPVSPADPEAPAFAALAQSFFEGVRAHNLEKLSSLATEEESAYLRLRLKDESKPEFQELYTNPNSAARRFEGWAGLRWIASRNRHLDGRGDGAVQCMSDSAQAPLELPEDHADFWNFHRSGEAVCVFSHRTEDEGRVISFGFLYPE